MRYALALLCPPLALLACHRRFAALTAAILFVLAMVTARWGVGVLVDFFLIVWASNAAGDFQAAREARAFVETVEPIPVIRS